MLDVHAPHKPIHGLGEFFLHLFTISVGLLIAVGIEAAVTRHEHRVLADEARDSMTAEIRRNQANVDDALRSLQGEQARLKSNLDQLAKVQAAGVSAGKDLSLDATVNTTSLEHTAWRTAQATGALAYMPYEQAKRFSSIYEDAEQFEQAQAQWGEDEAALLGLIRRYLPNHQPLTKEGADAMAQEVGAWQAHLLNIHIRASVLQEEQKAFLEGREPQRHMSEKLSN
jgi:hypothetical protein